MKFILCLELSSVQVPHNVLVFNLKWFNASARLVELDLLFISYLADFTIALVVESFFLVGFTSFTTVFFEHFLTFLDYFVLLDNFFVLIAFKLDERIRIFGFIFLSLKLATVLFSFGCLCFNKFLLFLNDLFEGPASLHPALQQLFDFFIAHLPSLNFFAHMTCLLCKEFNFFFLLQLFRFCNLFDCFLELSFAAPGLLEQIFEPERDWVTGLLPWA